MIVRFGAVFPISGVLALPLSYVISKKGQDKTKLAWVVIVWIWFLILPLWGKASGDLPIRHVATMMTSVLAFILPLKITQMIVVSNDKSLDKEKKSIHPNQLSWEEGVDFCGNILFYALPISAVKDRSQSILIEQNSVTVIISLIKAFLLQFFGLLLVQVAEIEPDPNTRSNLVYMVMLVLMSFTIIASSFISDLQGVMVNIVTFGKYEMTRMHNFPFVSKSLRELWGHRYNLLITTLLRDTVYGPCQAYLGLDRDASSMAVFTVSGLLHSYVSHFTFGYGQGRSLLFFVLQVPWMVWVEPSFTDLPDNVRRCITLAFFYATLPLYGGLFVEAMPEWIYKNFNGPIISVVATWTDYIAVPLGILSSHETKALAEAWRITAMQ